MAKASKDFPSRVQKALGAERVISLEDLPNQGPLDLIQLAAELKSRLQSSGGRPSDPEWDLRRTIPLKKEHWLQLNELAAALSKEGREISPAQLAAVLLERALASVKIS